MAAVIDVAGGPYIQDLNVCDGQEERQKEHS